MSRVSFPGERYVRYTVLRKKEMNNKRKEDKSEKTLTKKDEQLKNYKQWNDEFANRNK